MDISVPVGDYGSIGYKVASKKFAAMCGNPRHGSDCKRTRTAKPQASELGNIGQGRPWGLLAVLAAWLKLAYDQSSADAHKDAIDFITGEERPEGRRDFKAMPNSSDILSHEREQEDHLGLTSHHLRRVANIELCLHSAFAIPRGNN